MSTINNLILEASQLSKSEVGERIIPDGIYDLSGIEFLYIEGELYTKTDRLGEDKIEFIKKFVAGNKDTFAVGNAYETYAIVLLASKPPKAKIGLQGSGFEGHGTTAVLDLTKSPTPVTQLLILGEND